MFSCFPQIPRQIRDFSSWPVILTISFYVDKLHFFLQLSVRDLASVKFLTLEPRVSYFACIFFICSFIVSARELYNRFRSTLLRRTFKGRTLASKAGLQLQYASGIHWRHIVFQDSQNNYGWLLNIISYRIPILRVHKV